MKKGFDQTKYLKLQTEKILERVEKYQKIYLEVGGKLADDLHAARVLPGFDPSSKIQVLKNLKDKMEIIVCVSANDVEQNKIRADHGITYAEETFRLIDDLRDQGLIVNNIVITLFDNQSKIKDFKEMLINLGLEVHIHSKTPGYPTDVDKIVSPDGYGRNSFVKTDKPIVVITAPGPNSGKMATCLSQIYHESQNHQQAGYAKYETFPVWDLPLKHPVNVAYEAATLDLMDVNMIDPFHLEIYGKEAINYNRDIETFPVLRRIFAKIYGRDIYKSPTDMGVNMVGSGIIDDDVVREAAKQEIIRRYYRTKIDNLHNRISDKSLERAILIMNELEIKVTDRKVVSVAHERLAKLRQERPDQVNQVFALEFAPGEITTGKNLEILSPVSTAFLNSLKNLANVDDDVLLISPTILEPLRALKLHQLGFNNLQLNLNEVFLILSVSTTQKLISSKILNQITKLKNTRAHATYLLSENDQKICQALNIDLTMEMNEL